MLKSETMKRLILFLITAVLVVSCEYLDPRPIQDLSTEELLSNAAYGEGLLTQGYMNLSTEYIDYTDYYTDNAVPSVPGGNRVALGNWTVFNNPVGAWDKWYETIGYLNIYLRDCKHILFSVSDPALNKVLQKQRRGEAFFLRAYYEHLLLRTYGGYASGSNVALGFPIVTEVLTTDDDLNLPRNTYEECVKQIADDCDSAIVLLPVTYNGASINDNYANRGRADGLSARALKARVYLYAASPAYGPSTQDLWIRAANAANETRLAWGDWLWLQPYADFVNNGQDMDNIFIQPAYQSNDWEYAYYPPSLFGNGTCNPSQNLVDAFPCVDGYPIEESPLYDPTSPYVNRDPRLAQFIFYNGMNYNGTKIQTYTGGNDAPGGLSNQGTRTGYYLKKNLNKNVRLTPGDVTSSFRFRVFLSMSEVYLNFAEAANEAYGPLDKTFGPSAWEVLSIIRHRGIWPLPVESDDPYLTAQANLGKEAFRSVVQNERRIELCFEGHRFWDVRRWNLPLNHTVEGAKITKVISGEIPDPANVALVSTVSTDYCSPWETLTAVNDGYEPASSYDNSHGEFGNWYSGNDWGYIQYDFPQAYKVNQSDIYWFTDDGGILIPTSVYIQYWDQATTSWINVENPSSYAAVKNQWCVTTFKPVTTTKIRINFINSAESCGVLEWQVWEAPVNPYTYEYQDVESHSFQSYMRYIPVPYNQTLVMSNLKQNSGW